MKYSRRYDKLQKQPCESRFVPSLLFTNLLELSTLFDLPALSLYPGLPFKFFLNLKVKYNYLPRAIPIISCQCDPSTNSKGNGVCLTTVNTLFLSPCFRFVGGLCLSCVQPSTILVELALNLLQALMQLTKMPLPFMIISIFICTIGIHYEGGNKYATRTIKPRKLYSTPIWCTGIVRLERGLCIWNEDCASGTRIVHLEGG